MGAIFQAQQIRDLVQAKAQTLGGLHEDRALLIELVVTTYAAVMPFRKGGGNRKKRGESP